MIDARRRRYARAEALEAAGGWTVALDDKPLNTPAGAALIAPNRAVAEEIAAEWAAQGARIDPFSMPFTRFGCTALDRVAPRRDAVIDDLAGYAATDLTLHRAESPEALRALEARAWDGFLDWCAERFGARLVPCAGIVARPQPPQALAALRGAVALRDEWALAALSELVALSGSLLIGLAVLEGARAPEEGWAASRVDEDYQIRQWGEDDEAAAAAARKRLGFLDAARLAALLRAQNGPSG